jgi:outer membrane protein assembly factor BamA
MFFKKETGGAEVYLVFKYLNNRIASSAVAAALAFSILLALVEPVFARSAVQTPIEDDPSRPRLNATPAPGPARNYVVADVKIEGNRLVSTEEINGVIKTRPGDKYDRDLVLKDIKAIHGMGYFDEQSLQVNPEMTSGGVLLKIYVKENPVITRLSVSGNRAISGEEICRLFAGQLGKPQNLNALSVSIDKVEAVYREQGYPLARVIDVKDAPDGSVELLIDEGKLRNIGASVTPKVKAVERTAATMKSGVVPAKMVWHLQLLKPKPWKKPWLSAVGTYRRTSGLPSD